MTCNELGLTNILKFKKKFASLCISVNLIYCTYLKSLDCLWHRSSLYRYFKKRENKYLLINTMGGAHWRMPPSPCNRRLYLGILKPSHQWSGFIWDVVGQFICRIRHFSPPLAVIAENVPADENKINYRGKLLVSKASFCAISRQNGLGYWVNNNKRSIIG